MAAAYRSTKPVQPWQSSGLLNAIESPTATSDQGAISAFGAPVLAGAAVGAVAAVGTDRTVGAPPLAAGAVVELLPLCGEGAPPQSQHGGCNDDR